MNARNVSARWRVSSLVALPLGAFWPARTVAAQDWPGEDSADAGFAYDMIRHHAQAVEMAMILYKRTDDAVLTAMAYDIALTQQAQIGMMLGWLDIWGLPRTSTRPAMAWMGHPVDGLMPGMATGDEVESLRELPDDEMEVQFLRLMIPHHQGGVEMAEAGVRLVESAPARNLAATIAASQTAEIEQMQQMLEERGRPRVTGDASGGEEGEPATPDHGHGG